MASPLRREQAHIIDLTLPWPSRNHRLIIDNNCHYRNSDFTNRLTEKVVFWKIWFRNQCLQMRRGSLTLSYSRTSDFLDIFVLFRPVCLCVCLFIWSVVRSLVCLFVCLFVCYELFCILCYSTFTHITNTHWLTHEYTHSLFRIHTCAHMHMHMRVHAHT